MAVFARDAVPGRVKTRLSPALPPSLAADLHRAMLEDAVSAAMEAPADERFLYWAREAGSSSVIAIPHGLTERDQVPGDLGERLGAAFAELLTEGEDRGVVIGADCPDLEPQGIEQAFDALESHDLALGPARDGGFYLIGLRRLAPALFAGVPWGTGQVLQETLQRARDARLTVARLPELEDLDTPADLLAFLRRRFLDPDPPGGAGPRTEAALRGMGLLPPVT